MPLMFLFVRYWECSGATKTIYSDCNRCWKNMISWWFLFPSGMKKSMKRYSTYHKPHLEQDAESLFLSLSGNSQLLWVLTELTSSSCFSSSNKSDPNFQPRYPRRMAQVSDSQNTSVLAVLLELRESQHSLWNLPFPWGSASPVTAPGEWPGCLLRLSRTVSTIPCHNTCQTPRLVIPREGEEKQDGGISAPMKTNGFHNITDLKTSLSLEIKLEIYL